MISYRLPVTVKGIVFENNKVWLRHNERDEWELPGGKLEPGEQPVETCRREIGEELGLQVVVERIIQADLYTIQSSNDESRGVLVVSYFCTLTDRVGVVESAGEAGVAQFSQFALNEIDALKMPSFYKTAIKAAAAVALQ